MMRYDADPSSDTPPRNFGKFKLIAIVIAIIVLATVIYLFEHRSI